jgi:hypothetical protein
MIYPDDWCLGVNLGYSPHPQPLSQAWERGVSCRRFAQIFWAQALRPYKLLAQTITPCSNLCPLKR